MRSLLILIIAFVMCCCTTTRYIEVPVETIRTEYINNTKFDSVFIRDSVDRWIQGDTLYIYKEHTKFKYINKTDTICKTDTITKTIKVDVVRNVEVNHIHWYQKILMGVGIISLIIIVLKLKFK